MILTADKKFYIPNEDKCGWRWGVGYEFKPFLSTMKQINKKNVALDIGAHVGIWSKRLAKEFTKVIAFEPIPQHIECWKTNVMERNAIMNGVAISDKKGTATMKYINYFTGMSTLHYDAEVMAIEFKKLTKEKVVKQPKDVSVNTRTIDSYDLYNVSFIKMDVEGHELQALKGAERTIRNYKPPIYIEIVNKDAYIFLTELGYRQEEDFGNNHYLFKCVI